MTSDNSAIKEILHHRAETYFACALHAIDQARFSVDIESYIFSANDNIARRMSRALINAAQKGVRVRLIVDGAGIDDAFLDTAKQLREAGVKVRIYHPFPWHLKFWPMAVNVSQGVQKFWYLANSANKRNHRKTILVDNQSLLLGSFNITQDHFLEEHKGKGWRDTGIEIHGADTLEVSKAFNRIWYRWRRFPKNLTPSPSPLFVLNHTRRLRKQLRTGLFQRIDQASNRIWITNAYFVPDAKVIKHLIHASKRGVEVRVLVPHRSDISFIPWITRNFYEMLLDANIRIFEYLPGMHHAKTLIIDDWGTVGSSNFNRRSFAHDLEVDYVLQNTESLKELEGAFIKDLSESEEQTIKTVIKQHPRWQRVMGAFILILLGYWV